MEPKVYYGVHNSPPLVPILSQMHLVHTLPISQISIQLSFHLLLGLLIGLFFSAFPTKILYKFLVCPMRITCPVHVIALALITLILSGEVFKLWSSSFRSLLQPPTTSSLLDQNILLSTLFANTFILCYSLSLRHKVSHTHTHTHTQNKRQNHSFIYFVFKFLDRRWEDKRLWREKQQAFPNIVYYFLRQCSFDFLLLFPNIWTLPHFQRFCYQSVNYDYALYSGERHNHALSFLCVYF
jgi:hypothetical protein